jgi:hypothetical protein
MASTGSKTTRTGYSQYVPQQSSDCHGQEVDSNSQRGQLLDHLHEVSDPEA